MQTTLKRKDDKIWQITILVNENGIPEAYVGTTDAPVLRKFILDPDLDENERQTLLETAADKIISADGNSDVLEIKKTVKSKIDIQTQDVYCQDSNKKLQNLQFSEYTYPNLSLACKSLSVSLFDFHLQPPEFTIHPLLFRLLSLYVNGPLFSALVESPHGILRYIGTLMSIIPQKKSKTETGTISLKVSETFEKEISKKMLEIHNPAPTLHTELVPHLNIKTHGCAGICVYHDAVRIAELQKEISEHNEKIPDNCEKVYESASCLNLQLEHTSYLLQSQRNSFEAELQILKSESLKGEIAYTLRYTIDRANMKWALLAPSTSLCWNKNLYMPSHVTDILQTLYRFQTNSVLYNPWQMPLFWTINKQDETTSDTQLRKLQFNILKSITNHPSILKTPLVAFAEPPDPACPYMYIATQKNRAIRVYQLWLNYHLRKGKTAFMIADLKKIPNIKWQAEDPAKDKAVNKLINLTNVLDEL